MEVDVGVWKLSEHIAVALKQLYYCIVYVLSFMSASLLMSGLRLDYDHEQSTRAQKGY